MAEDECPSLEPQVLEEISARGQAQFFEEILGLRGALRLWRRCGLYAEFVLGLVLALVLDYDIEVLIGQM